MSPLAWVIGLTCMAFVLFVLIAVAWLRQTRVVFPPVDHEPMEFDQTVEGYLRSLDATHKHRPAGDEK